MSYIINSKKIADIISGSIDSLESEYEIEDLLVAINRIKDKISFLENLKRQRSKDIQREIDKFDDRISKLEEVVKKTLKNAGRKTLDFPGVGKVSIVNRKGKWVVQDESQLLEILKEKDEAAYEKTITLKPVIAKKILDEILDQWEATGMIPDCVVHKDLTEHIKINFKKDVDIEETEEIDNSTDIGQDYDNLEI